MFDMVDLGFPITYLMNIMFIPTYSHLFNSNQNMFSVHS